MNLYTYANPRGTGLLNAGNPIATGVGLLESTTAALSARTALLSGAGDRGSQDIGWDNLEVSPAVIVGTGVSFSVPTNEIFYSTSASLEPTASTIDSLGFAFTDNQNISLDPATIQAISTAVWQQAIEAGYSAEEILRLLSAHAAGSATGLENGLPVFKSLDGSKNRIVGSYVAGTRTVTGRDAS